MAIRQEAWQVQPVTHTERQWMLDVLQHEWGEDKLITRGRVTFYHSLNGLFAARGAERGGLLTYRIEANECEITSLNSFHEREGVGTRLLAAVQAAAQQMGCQRLFLITTNDNLNALGFYQRRGFTLAALYVNALAESRRLKPSIPRIGMQNIPLRDELELEFYLSPEMGSAI